MLLSFYVIFAYFLQVHDVFPYSIGLPVDGGKNKTHKEITLFSKSSSFPNRHTIKYRGETPLHIQVYYTDKTDFPAGLSPKVGHFMVRIIMCALKCFNI